jgi:copper(I)-binding protein
MSKSIPVFVSLMLVLASTTAAELQVVDPWVREPPPGASAVGAFMVLKNTGNEPAVIEAITSPIGDAVEMHRTLYSGGMARMVPQNSLTVPANGELVLKPGSYHIMVIRPPALKDGEHVALELELADGSRVPVDAVVRRKAGGGHHHHHH